MHDASLVRLERIARNLPIVSRLEMISSPAKWGDVYMAYGQDAEGNYHGVWGARVGSKDIGRTVTFHPGISENVVQKALFIDADATGAMAAADGL